MGHDLWIVPALVLALLYFTCGKYLPGDEIPEVALVRCVRNNNVEFYQEKFSDAASDFYYHLILRIWTVRNIKVGEKLQCDCCNSYDFNSVPELKRHYIIWLLS